MKVINKKMCVVFVLVILEISSLFLMYKSNSNKEIKLDSIKIEEQELDNDNMFAIMIETTVNNYTNYTSSNTWPSSSNYVFNPLKSGCVDNGGNKIENGMKYDKTNKKITVNINKTAYCYVYFSMDTITKLYYASTVWISELFSDGYRYYGTQDGTISTVNNVPNYVCFGTQSKNECVNDTDKYMYRIIGVFSSEVEENGYNIADLEHATWHLKLIKKEALNSRYAWDTDGTSDNDWSVSTLYKELNGSYFLTNDYYPYLQNNYWYSKIANWKWSAVNTRNYSNSGQSYVNNLVAQNVYFDELNRNGSVSGSQSIFDTPTAKIGLMYASDFLLSLGITAKNYKSSNTEYLNSWLHMSNSDSATLSSTGAPPTSAEFVLARSGMRNSKNYAYILNSTPLTTVMTSQTAAIRPVFYLNEDVVICGGSGTSTDPYILG